MKMEPNDPLDELVRQVQASAKYADISPELVRSIGEQELGKRRGLKEAVKATRNKLHQVGASFQETPIPYAQLLQELDKLPVQMTDPATLVGLKRFMGYHASTRERLPALEKLFNESLASIAPIRSVLDIACGLNPLAIPWMPLSETCTYQALDIYSNLVNFLNQFFEKYAINGHAEVSDVLQSLPTQPVHLALILKTLPCLEQINKQAGKQLLENIQAENLLVSFPSHGLGGRSKGMLQNYEAHFRELTAGKPWQVQRFEFTGELVFLVHKE